MNTTKENNTTLHQKYTYIQISDSSRKFVKCKKGEYLKYRLAYAILGISKMTEMLMTFENPDSCSYRGFLFRFWVGGLFPRLATYHLRPTICICNRQQHLPQRRIKMTEIYS
jgi:hypothetical protein